MSDLLVSGAFLAFVLFFAAGEKAKYAALAGWSFLLLNIWSDLPAYLAEKNFLYPLIALLALPFLYITAGRLLKGDPTVIQLSRAAAVATIIWVPLAFVPFLRDSLTALVAGIAFAVITALGHHPQLMAGDVIAENGFYNKIIPGCTGILATAVMLGVVFSERDLSRRQAAAGLLLVVPPIFILNLLRVAGVFIAVSDRWFASFPDPTGTGRADFFYAHNVIAEALALLFLVLLVLALVRVIPRLGFFLRGLAAVYLGRPAGGTVAERKIP